jgi:hypothetical protein
LAGEAHGGRQGRRVLLLYLKAEWRQESPREKLDALALLQSAGARQQGLESVLVFLHGSRPAAGRELEQWCGTEGRTVAEIQELLEPIPGRDPFCLLDVDIPQLRPILQII